MALGQTGSNQGPVLTCKVEDCSYNQHDCCYAPQIEVGDDHPMCDTYTRGQAGNLSSSMAMVGVCHVADCSFNQSEQCNAAGITVAFHQQHADCFTSRFE